MRLPLIDPEEIDGSQRALFANIQALTEYHLSSFITHAKNGSAIGPFNVLLHVPELGSGLWALIDALFKHSELPFTTKETVILLTGADRGAPYELYSHESVAASHGMSAQKVRSLAAGQRSPGLSTEEAIAVDATRVLLSGRPLPNSVYRAVHDAFGVHGAAEIAYLIGCYTTICTLLNTFDVDVPGSELGPTAEATK